MFGNTGIQSSWANPQQNQQQPQQPQQPQSGSVFGQPSAFSSAGGGAGGAGGASHTIDTFSLPLSTMFLFFPQFLDLVEALAKIHNSSLSRRTQCLEILLPILILHLQQGARRLVSLFHFFFGIFLLISIHQGRLGATTTLRLVTQSPLLGLARLEVEGHLPLARVAEHSVRLLHLNRLRQTQACSAKQIPLGARSELVHLVTSRQQARSDQRVVCLQRKFL
jgi:hypothetical protein